jgi:hypothetical protein
MTFLRLVTLFTEDWLDSYNYLHKHAHYLYQHLQTPSFIYNAEQGWGQRTAGQIVWYLKQMEMKNLASLWGNLNIAQMKNPLSSPWQLMWTSPTYTSY